MLAGKDTLGFAQSHGLKLTFSNRDPISLNGTMVSYWFRWKELLIVFLEKDNASG